ncbi:hypothetical protein BH09VER1_BH09VER1_53070 [soil metagenome]
MPNLDLDQLLQVATQYSREVMQTHGNMPPTLIAAAAGDVIVFSPAPFRKPADTAQFAEVARLVAAGFHAHTVVIVLTMWSLYSKGQEKPKLRPSESPDRKEAVLIAAESREGNVQRLLCIERDTSGNFSGFSPEDTRPFDEMDGPFADILSQTFPTPSEALTARSRLKEMGFVIP